MISNTEMKCAYIVMFMHYRNQKNKEHGIFNLKAVVLSVTAMVFL